MPPKVLPGKSKGMRDIASYVSKPAKNKASYAQAASPGRSKATTKGKGKSKRSNAPDEATVTPGRKHVQKQGRHDETLRELTAMKEDDLDDTMSPSSPPKLSRDKPKTKVDQSLQFDPQPGGDAAEDNKAQDDSPPDPQQDNPPALDLLATDVASNLSSKPPAMISPSQPNPVDATTTTYKLDTDMPIHRHYHQIIAAQDQGKIEPLNQKELFSDTKDTQAAKALSIILHSPLAKREQLDLTPSKLDLTVVQEICRETFKDSASTDLYKSTKDRKHVGKWLLRLPMTPPERYSGFNPRTQLFVNPSTVEIFAFAMHSYMGPIFRYKVQTALDKQGNPLPRKSRYTRKVQTTDGQQQPPIQQAPKAVQGEKPPPEKPANATFFHIITPTHEPFPEDPKARWPFQNKIAAQQIASLLSALYKVDPKAKVVRFPTAKNQKCRLWIHHLSPAAFLPKDKRSVGNYIFNHWLQPDGSAPRNKGRLLIWHEVDAEVIVNAFQEEIDWDQCCEEIDQASFTITKAPIQAERVTRVGWLYASTFYTNCDNLLDSLMETKIMKANSHIHLDISWSAVLRAPNERPSMDPATRCYAAHIQCAAEHHAEASALLANIYKETRKAGQPQSKKFHFIPDMSAPECDCRGSAQTQDMYEACMDGQRMFQQTVKSIELRDIIQDPTKPLGPHNNMNLYDVISAIRDPNDPEYPLFLGLDQDKDQLNLWHLTVKAPLYAAASDLALRIGIALSLKLGDDVWAWYTPRFKANQYSQFKQDGETKRWISDQERLLKVAEQQILIHEYDFDDITEDDFPPCLITNLTLKLPDGHRVRSQAPSMKGAGRSLASTVGDKANMSLGSQDSIAQEFAHKFLDSDSEGEKEVISVADSSLSDLMEERPTKPVAIQQCLHFTSLRGLQEALEADLEGTEADLRDILSEFNLWSNQPHNRTGPHTRQRQRNLYANVSKLCALPMVNICKEDPMPLTYGRLVMICTQYMIRFLPPKAIGVYVPVIHVLLEEAGDKLSPIYDSLTTSWLITGSNTVRQPTMTMEFIAFQSFYHYPDTAINTFQHNVDTCITEGMGHLGAWTLEVLNSQAELINNRVMVTPERALSPNITLYLELPPILNIYQTTMILFGKWKDLSATVADKEPTMVKWLASRHQALPTNKTVNQGNLSTTLLRWIDHFRIDVDSFCSQATDHSIDYIIHQASLNFPYTFPAEESDTDPYYYLPHTHPTLDPDYDAIHNRLRNSWVMTDPRTHHHRNLLCKLIVSIAHGQDTKAVTQNIIDAGFTNFTKRIYALRDVQRAIRGRAHSFYQIGSTTIPPSQQDPMLAETAPLQPPPTQAGAAG